MRSALFKIGCVSVALSAAVACATSEDSNDSAIAPAPGDGGVTTLPDAMETPVDPGDAGVDAEAGEVDTTCSAAGWCLTELPDPSLNPGELVPLQKHAFAMGHNEALGTKILEWSDATQAWSYIDDRSQHSIVGNARSLWAPNENEVYYFVSDYSPLYGEGAYGGYLFRGTRPVAPATAWSWTRERFDCDGVSIPEIPGFLLPEEPEVWGTGSGDVYALSCGAIHRSTGSASDAGTGSWRVDYVDDDPSSRIEFTGATGTGPDDVWFLGRRGGFSPCAVVLHKTAAGYETVVDAIVNPDGTCGQKAGLPTIEGTITSPTARSNQLVVVAGGRLLKIARDGEGAYALTYAGVSHLPGYTLVSAWADSDSDAWLVGNSGKGIVYRGTNVWGPAGALEISTIALNGAANQKALSQIIGTSNKNLWVIGAERAFHKTTP